MEKRRQWNFYLVLFSGLQMLCTLYYAFDIAKGLKTYEKFYDTMYSRFKFGFVSLFFCSIIYHCISKPLYRGTSGVPMQYFAALTNLAQVIGLICFAYPIFKKEPSNVWHFVQTGVYIITLVLGVGLNYVSWHTVPITTVTIDNSWLISRRRDWGLSGHFFAAFQIIMIFWETIKTIKDPTKPKKVFGDFFTAYELGLLLMMVAAIVYHSIALPIAKGKCPCHPHLKITGLVSICAELVGLVMYWRACTQKDQARMFFTHVIIFALGMIVSGFGVAFMSWNTIDEEVKVFRNAQALNSQPLTQMDSINKN